MNMDYTDEGLQLAITEAVYTNDGITSMSQLLQLLFATDDRDSISRTLENFVRQHYINQTKGFVRHFGKKHIYEQLNAGSSAFIERFEAQQSLQTLLTDLPRVQLRIQSLLQENAEGSLFTEFSRYFVRLRNRFVPIQMEESFRLALIDWFRSGEMNKQTRSELDSWFRKGVRLHDFKQMSFPTATARDHHRAKAIKAAQQIPTDEFMELIKLNEVLIKFLTPPVIKLEDGRIRLSGRTIFLSDWIADITKKCAQNSDLDVEIHAVDCCGIDCNVNLSGVNVQICANRVYIWQSHTIVLSGSGYTAGKSRAADAQNGSERGANGIDGHCGNSSGNFVLYAKDMVNSDWLTVHVNGGRGQDGSDGGNGYDGKDGVGINQQQLDDLCVKYSSLYFNWWSTFQSYAAPSNWTRTTCNWDASKQFGYEEYTDANGRTIRYSFAGDVGWTYTTYHLYFMVIGSQGTAGTQGGSNGVGGEGGYRGTCRAENPETGESFPIQIQSRVGQNGTNGVVGRSGRHGNNGNDMVLIDRSVTGGQKHYIGSSTAKLSTSFGYEATTYSRLNGFRKHIDGKSACFASFSTTEMDMTQRRAEASVARTQLTRTSKAVAKRQVIAEEMLSRAAAFFEAEDAFLADACKQSAAARDAVENEDVEEEATENVSEQVVVLRQRDEVQITRYTTDSEKRIRPTVTPQNLIQRIKVVGRFGTIGSTAQNIFDLFAVEIPASLLDSVRFQTLFQKNHFFHAVMDSKLSRVMIAALQDRLVDGKSLNEIITIAQGITVRRREKFAFAQFHDKLQKFVHAFETIQCHPNLTINVGADKLYGIKKLSRGDDLAHVKSRIDHFFRDFPKYRVQQDLLNLLHDFYKRIDQKYVTILQSFDEAIDWTDEHSCQSYFNMLQAWLKEEEERKKAAENDNDNAHQHRLRAPRQKTELEARFETWVAVLDDDKNRWAVLLNALHHHINNDKNLVARFGKVPNLSEERSLRQQASDFLHRRNIHNSIEPALYLIRLYWLSSHILTYMRHLYNCNELFAMECGKRAHQGVYSDDGNQSEFDQFANRATAHPLDVASEACQLHMEAYGMGCAPVRYLMAHKCGINYQTYKESGYHELSKTENFNPSGKQVELLWADEHEAYGIAMNEAYHDLVEAQVQMTRSHAGDLQVELAAEAKHDYRQSIAQEKFASFYAKPFRSAIIQWVEGYLALTNDQIILNHLHHRFTVDGCHLTPFELQFILLSCTKLQINCRCTIQFLVLLASSVSQSGLINVLLYMQLIYHRVSRFGNTKVYDGIQLIDSTRHKALFAVKLQEHQEPIDAELTYKLVLMLQHSANGSEQLENMNLYEWIDIANKQKWSEIGALIQRYGEVGYYLGFLDDRGYKDEARRMCKVLDLVHYIPEIIIALISQLIVSGEVKADEDYFDALQRFLESGNDYGNLKINSNKRPYLITRESEQHMFLDYIQTRSPELSVSLLPNCERTVDEMIQLVRGLHDVSEEAKATRLVEVERIGEMVRILESPTPAENLLTDSMRLLRDYDRYTQQLHKIKLRATQKMAILYAVESDKNVLEQVNTGEGKSYIIAAIAIIRCKLGYKHVDIITSSPVLAQRDAEKMQNLYAEFGLTVGHNCDEDIEKRKKAYESSVVYGDIARFQRDYLLHTFYKKNILGDRTCDAVVVDEVDNMLLDNGNNMLYLSHNVVGLNLLDSLLIFIQKQVYQPSFNGVKSDLGSMRAHFDDQKIKQAVLQDIYGQLTVDDLMKLKSHEMNVKDVNQAFERLIQSEFIDTDGYVQITNADELAKLDQHFEKDKVFLIRLKSTLRIILTRQREIDLPKYLRDFVKLHLNEFIKSSKHALFMSSDHEYVVDVDHSSASSSIEPRITIIDANTGTDLTTSQWTGGLHQFLQIKHGCRVSPISLKAVFVSNVAYLKGYQKINGLSGTLGSTHESQTLIDMYTADLVKIPTFQPKMFYEHVPVIATSEDSWLQSLYDEVCDQAMANRSVLIICDSIAQVRNVKGGLQLRYQQEVSPATKVVECFENVTIYEREFNKFNFEAGSEFQCSRLIIATNLAGRGTDIKLSAKLIKSNGLHVITAFIPANCRIEEQAFGRAARCGQPGSAQIIAMGDTDDGTQPSVFQLKMFRDNAEVHRLASLQSFYDYHTATEEKCLEKFRAHCSQALGAIASSKNQESAGALPTPAQVVYFALLDQWALWLDRNEPRINHVTKNRLPKEKDAIIQSVDDFLSTHSIGGETNCYATAKNWIDAPQSLLTLGIIQMSHQQGFQAAEETFDRILADGHEFAAEVYYFKACMRMTEWTATRDTLRSMEISSAADFPRDVAYAIEYFSKSRALFTSRAQRRQQHAKDVTQFMDLSGPNHIKTCGFVKQQEEIATVYELIIANIDWILGIPCKPDMFVVEGVPKDYASEVYDSFVRQGVISPILIPKYEREDWQLTSLRHKFKLSRAGIAALVDGIKNDARCETFDDESVLDVDIMTAHVKLAHRIGFWMELKKLSVFVHAKTISADGKVEDLEERIKHVLLVQPEFKDKLPPWISQLTPVPEPDDEAVRYQIRLSNETEHGLMYHYSDIVRMNNATRVDEVEQLVKSNVLQHDWIGQINVKMLRRIGYLDVFDGITTTDVAEFFNIDAISAAWIIDMLTEHGVLKRDTSEMHGFIKDDELWQKRVGVYLDADKETLTSLIAQHADGLTQIRNLPLLKNVTPWMLGRFCDIDDNDQQLALFQLLKEEKLLYPFFYTKFRTYGKIDCSCLPPSIANEVDEFLSDRFAYSFALEYLCAGLDDSVNNPRTPKKLFLPENPQQELYKELLSVGIGQQSRISQADYAFLDLDDYDQTYKAQLQMVVNTHRTKLWDQTHYHMRFVPSTAYFTAQKQTIDTEVKAIIDNGLLMVVSKKDEDVGWKLQNFVIDNVVKAGKELWRGLKAVGNFFYDISSSVCKFVSPFIDGCIDAFDFVAEKAIAAGSVVKEKVIAAVDAIAETAIVKMATQTVKDVASAVGQAAVTIADQTGLTTAAKAVGSVAVTAATKVKNVAAASATAVKDAALDVARGIVDTKVFRAAAEVFNTAMNAAKNAYQQMTSYVKATVESYQYYNQCRFAARRLAIQSQGMVDEHLILRSYDKALQEENRVEANDNIFEQRMRDHVLQWAEAWLSQMKPLVTSTVHAQYVKLNGSFSGTSARTALEGGQAMRRLIAEVNEHMAVLANLTKTVFFQIIKHNAVERKNNLATLSLPELTHLQSAHNIKQLTEPIQLICEEVEETAKCQQTADALSSAELVLLVQNTLQEKLKGSVDSVFVEPTIRLVLAFLASCRNRPQLATMSAFRREDTAVKKAISDFNASTQSKKNAEFLLTELQEAVITTLGEHPTHKELLKFAVRFGFPLPIEAAKPIANAAHSIFVNNNYSTGYIVRVYDENAAIDTDKPLLEFATKEGGKMKVNVRCVNGRFFLCQADFKKYSGSDDINGVFFYESLMDKMRNMKKCFPKHELSFRELLLKHL